MHSRDDNIKFSTYNDANEIVDELFESSLKISRTFRNINERK